MGRIVAGSNLTDAGLSTMLPDALARRRPGVLECSMPYDRRDSGEISDQEEDDDKKSGRAQGGKRRFDEFDCPTCSANNPVGDGFGSGDEVMCNYCGLEFRVQVDDEGKLKLREL